MRWLVVLPFALAGCPTVELGDQPSPILVCTPPKGEAYFESEIWPSYINNTKKSCVMTGCHDQSDSGGGALHFKTNPVDLVANFRTAQGYLNCGFPSASELYTRPCGIDAHGGGVIFDCPSGPEAQLFLAWFAK
jgi:hypothetical protein